MLRKRTNEERAHNDGAPALAGKPYQVRQRHKGDSPHQQLAIILAHGTGATSFLHTHDNLGPRSSQDVRHSLSNKSRWLAVEEMGEAEMQETKKKRYQPLQLKKVITTDAKGENGWNGTGGINQTYRGAEGIRHLE